MKNIAVINLGYIGDVINASPVCIELKKTYPNSNLIFITVPSSIETAKCLPGVDEVIAFDRYNEHKGLKIFNLAFRIRQKYKIDAAFLLTDNFRCAFLAFLIGAKKRIGRSNEGRDFLLTHKIPFLQEEKDLQIHVSEQYMRVLKPLRLYTENFDLKFNFSKEDETFINNLIEQNYLGNSELIGLCPATGTSIKNWDVENAAKFIKAQTGKVVIVGTEASRDFAKKLTEAEVDNFVDLSCKTSISQLGALISRFNSFVSIDSAPMHIAFALNTPTIALFFQENYMKWGPKNQKNNVLIHNINGKIEADLVINSIK